MNETFTIYNDTDTLEVIEKINKLLKLYNLSIEDDGEEHDGYCIYSLKDDN